MMDEKIIFEQTRQIIKDCEAAKQEVDTEYAKRGEELHAYEQIKMLFRGWLSEVKE